MKNVMVDLETLGAGNNAVIIAIGAVEFCKDAGIGRTFYELIDPQSCVEQGLKMDVDTVMWWMRQSDSARAAFDRPSRHLNAVLLDFATWFPEGAALWGNGATFDNVILSSAYKSAQINRPWGRWDDRCYRTLKNLRPNIKLARSGTHHNALDDARTQALHAIDLLVEVAT
jgi:exodeoxyribonuclease VIII